MLSQLKDIHIWIDSPAGRLPTYRSSYEANSDQNALRQKLRDVREFGTLGFVGSTEEGYGVIVVNSLIAEESATETFLAAIEELFDAPAMVVDLRVNAGGSEPLAARIAAMFADKRRMYAASLSRSGRKHDDLDRTGAAFHRTKERDYLSAASRLSRRTGLRKQWRSSCSNDENTAPCDADWSANARSKWQSRISGSA